MCANSKTNASSSSLRSILPANRSPQVLLSGSGLAAARIIRRRSCGRAGAAVTYKRKTSLITHRADGPEPRATSGQGRAYSAARGDMNSPDRPARSANNSPARCTISKPRRRDLTVHSKIAGPSKCSYRIKCSRRSWFHIPLVVSYPACGAHFTQ